MGLGEEVQGAEGEWGVYSVNSLRNHARALVGGVWGRVKGKGLMGRDEGLRPRGMGKGLRGERGRAHPPTCLPTSLPTS